VKVLFDAYWWVEGQPSGRRVVDSFLRTWLADWPEDELSAAVQARHLDRARALAGDAPLTLHPVRARPHGVSVLTELGRLARDADAVLSQNYTPLRADAVRAVFIHDLMFDEHPEFFSRVERAYFAGMPFSARFADVVLTSTAAEGARIARMRPRLAGKVRPVGLSVPEAFRSREPRDPGVGVEPGRFLLCVGRLNVRKNVDRLIDAVLATDLVRPDFPLVVVGEPNGLAIRGADADDRRVRFLGGVDDEASSGSTSSAGCSSSPRWTRASGCRSSRRRCPARPWCSATSRPSASWRPARPSSIRPTPPRSAQRSARSWPVPPPARARR